MARSLNKVELIGNLTRDPELRYTPAGAAVCTFGLATNRQWTTDSGEKKEEAEFHRIVAWNKLAELCAQLLTKGRKTYVEGRLQTRRWTGQDGVEHTTTEIVINDMIILDSRGATEARGMEDVEIPGDLGVDIPAPEGTEPQVTPAPKSSDHSAKAAKPVVSANKSAKKKEDKKIKEESEPESEDDIPF
jgi:single-strand DNA-binding protein